MSHFFDFDILGYFIFEFYVGLYSNGIVAEVMRKTRAQYHAAIRKARREEDNIVNDRFAAALAANRNRDFW